MADYLVLSNFQSPTGVHLKAGAIIGDASFDLPALRRSGLVSIVYDAASMAAPLAAFLSTVPVNPDTSLLDTLLISGVLIPGGALGAATQAEVDAGVVTTKGVTPATLAAAKTVSQPPSFVEAGAFAFSAAHIGGIVHATGAGAQAASLPTLAAALQAGRDMLLTVQPEAAANVTTVTPGAASQIDNAGVGVPYVPTAGQRFQLVSRDGLNWFSGAL